MVRLMTRALLITGEYPCYALLRNYLWIPEPVWHFWWKKYPYVLAGIEPQFLDLPNRSVIGVPTELSRLQGVRHIYFILFFVLSKVRCRNLYFALLLCILSDGKQIHDFVAM